MTTEPEPVAGRVLARAAFVGRQEATQTIDYLTSIPSFTHGILSLPGKPEFDLNQYIVLPETANRQETKERELFAFCERVWIRSRYSVVVNLGDGLKA